MVVDSIQFFEGFQIEGSLLATRQRSSSVPCPGDLSIWQLIVSKWARETVSREAASKVSVNHLM